MIRVQEQAFDVADELARLRTQNKTGATAIFIGSVRGLSEGRALSNMTLEHYPGMTENALKEIEDEAMVRFQLQASLIIHRYGSLAPGDDIVLVITQSDHRKEAFAACEFLMDWLKTKAPFWKLEASADQAQWVEAKASDDEAAKRWGEAT